MQAEVLTVLFLTSILIVIGIHYDMTKNRHAKRPTKHHHVKRPAKPYDPPKKQTQYNYSVYVIHNDLNQKIYIGMTSDFERRKSEHFDKLYRATQPYKQLYLVMNKMGEEHFQMTEILSGLRKSEAMYAESALIRDWRTYNKGRGYNVNKEKDARAFGYNVAKYNPELFEEIKKLSRKLDI